MIKVFIEETGMNFTKKVGVMTPNQIDDFIKLIQKQGVEYQNEKYDYVESHYCCNLDAYVLMVDISDNN